MDHGATRKQSQWRSGRSHRSRESPRPRHAAGRGDGPDRALRAARRVWHGGPAARGGGRGGIWHRARPRPGDRGPARHGWTAAPGPRAAARGAGGVAGSPARGAVVAAAVRAGPAGGAGPGGRPPPPAPPRRGPRGRGAPDDVAGRLHVLARIVGELRGAYNDQGIRRWFERRRTTLDDRTPQELLAGAWDPEAAGPGAVLAIARSLNASAAT